MLVYFGFLGWIAVCQAAEPSKNISQQVIDWTSVTGEAVGEFQFLGELYFPDSKKINRTHFSRIATMTFLTKEEAPNNLKVLLFDNQPTSFDMISRGESGDSCKANEMVSKSFKDCRPHEDCVHGLRVAEMSHSKFGPENDFCPDCHEYSLKINIETHTNLAWYFFAANCGGGPVQIEAYSIHSPQAGPMRPIFARSGDTGRTGIKGSAHGNFDLLGSLCFFEGPITRGVPLRTANITITYDNEAAARDTGAALMVFDDDGFDYLFDSKSDRYNSAYPKIASECRWRKSFAQTGFPLHGGTHNQTLTITPSFFSRGTEHAAFRLHFVVMQCDNSSSPLKVKHVKVQAPAAVDCASKCPPREDCRDVFHDTVVAPRTESALISEPRLNKY